jgi:hypothetical protein
MLLQAGEGIGFAQFGAAESNAVQFVADTSALPVRVILTWALTP